MLVSLNIRNYALIDSLSIDFNEGLNVLTGETGAGKSIIIGALSLALGDRANSEAIRDKDKKIFVQTLYELKSVKKELKRILDEYNVECDGSSLLITREVSDSGRNVCRVNDTIVSVAALREISSELIDIHGQHEHQKLLDAATHLSFLDMFGKTHIEPLKLELAQKYRLYSEAKKEYEETLRNAENEKELLDDYKRRLKQIKELKLTVGEDDALEERLKILTNSEKLFEYIDGAYSLMYRSENSVADILYTAQRDLSSAAAIDPKLTPLSNDMNDAAIALDEILLQIRDYKSSLEFDPAEIDELQSRLEQINSLKRKYGTLEDVLIAADSLEKKIEAIINFDEETTFLKAKYEEALSAYDISAVKLSEVRSIIAQRFENDLASNLHMLAMPNAVFAIDIKQNPDSRSPEGIDSVQFLFSANMGQEAKPLNKIASGGEISRFMLAAKAILADVDDIDTMIFDEIDTGISGRTAQTVAEKMCDISVNHQVICITHLPQLSSMADAHYLISKTEKDGKTTSSFTFLDKTQRKRELARMLGGVSVTETTLKYAEEMLHLAKEYKAKFLNGRNG